MVQILEGLCFLHENNIVHLDLKPQNILLTEPFPAGSIKICDLGFACLTNTGEDIRDIIGTPDYVAPEVLDYEPLSIQTDMWSLGVLAYVMLTACSPFAGDTQQETFCNISQVKLDFPHDLFSDISPEAMDFIRKLLVKDPRRRLTARQCLDHPWLQAAGAEMHVSLPADNKAAALAHHMVPPSNWNPDRRNSTGKTSAFIHSNSAAASGADVDVLDDGQSVEDQLQESAEDRREKGERVSDMFSPSPSLPSVPVSDEDMTRTIEEIGIDASRFSLTMGGSNSNSMDFSPSSFSSCNNKRVSMEIPMKKAKCVPVSPTTAEGEKKPEVDYKERGEEEEEEKKASSGVVAAAAVGVANGGNISLDMSDLTMTGTREVAGRETGRETGKEPAPGGMEVPTGHDACPLSGGGGGGEVDCLDQPGV